MKKLEGKRALITGAASGMGYEIVKLFAENGASIVFNYHTKETAATELKALVEKEYHTKIEKYQADCSEEDEVKAMVDYTVQELGGIDILVCSNGICFQVPLVDMTVEQWDHVIKQNLRSIFLLDHYVLPHMLKQKFGRIINITSQIGQIGGIDESHYAASKAGVIGMTKSLAREVSKYGITANCIAPGPVANDFFYKGTTPEWQEDKLRSLPLGRFGLDHEVAPSALLLASEPDGNIYTGQTLGPNCGDVML
ncbi:SDR family NAD(P)-dependent oxidoreductase [Massilistercora timonensis]|uniref:SDR family NAD(P)-dependent oxidoreductase n=1 Tax=Massilistercora timonensis TaxID=2086584 RepID=UPI0032083296